MSGLPGDPVLAISLHRLSGFCAWTDRATNGERGRCSGHRSDVHSLCFFRFRAWLFRQMIKDAPRWSSPRKKRT
eukprot:8648144-Pyramimonas_sp.AAC.1